MFSVILTITKHQTSDQKCSLTLFATKITNTLKKKQKNVKTRFLFFLIKTQKNIFFIYDLTYKRLSWGIMMSGVYNPNFDERAMTLCWYSRSRSPIQVVVTWPDD